MINKSIDLQDLQCPLPNNFVVTSDDQDRCRVEGDGAVADARSRHLWSQRQHAQLVVGVGQKVDVVLLQVQKINKMASGIQC